MSFDYQNQAIGRIPRGEDVVIPFALDGVDVSGWAIRFSLATAPGVTPAVAVTTAGGGVAITDGPAGEFEATVSAASSDGLSPKTYFWDVWRTDSGSRRALAGGTVEVYTPVAAYP